MYFIREMDVIDKKFLFLEEDIGVATDAVHDLSPLLEIAHLSQLYGVKRRIILGIVAAINWFEYTDKLKVKKKKVLCNMEVEPKNFAARKMKLGHGSEIAE